MHSWGWFLLTVCAGLFLGAELASWRADRRRNPERREIRGQQVLFRLDRVPVERARIDGRDQSKGFRGMNLVVRKGGVELTHVVPGHLLLVPDWYRHVEDVDMDVRQRPVALCLTFRSASGDDSDEVVLTLSPEDRIAVRDALSAAGVSCRPPPTGGAP